MDIAGIISWLTTNGQTTLEGILQIIGGAAILAALTPTPKDDKAIASVIRWVKKALDLLGGNFLNAKNEKKQDVGRNRQFFGWSLESHNRLSGSVFFGQSVGQSRRCGGRE